MTMKFHYGPVNAPTTSYGSPLKGTVFNAMRTRPLSAFDAMRTRQLSAFDTMRTRPLGENYFDVMRTRRVGMGDDVVANVKTGVDRALDFGAGFAVGYTLAPTAKDKTLYAWGAGLTSMFFGAKGLGVGALVLSMMKK